jgi:hypothetical protein
MSHRAENSGHRASPTNGRGLRRAGSRAASEFTLADAVEEAARATESGATIAQVGAAECAARILVAGLASCHDKGLPLSDLQQIELVKAALLEFEGFRHEIGEVLAVDRVLRGTLSTVSATRPAARA